MKKLFFVIGLIFLFAACNSDSKSLMTVNGEIKGLKKGTLYLKKLKDTSFVAIDSIYLDGVETYSLSDKIESPEVYHLVLNHDVQKTIVFFGDVGEITINTNLDKFGFRADIQGLENQNLLDEYSEMADRFNDERLDLIKAEFDFKDDSIKKDSILKLEKSLIRRRYLYTTQFAVRNADNVIAPFIALTELVDANIKLLDTVNNSLAPEVKTSKYGKKLEAFIKEIKSKE